MLTKFNVFKHEVLNQQGGCSNCGSTNAKGRLFQYHKKPSPPRLDGSVFGEGDVVYDGLFCRIGCLRTYIRLARLRTPK